MLTTPFKKYFQDDAGGEYAQSREYQFLDLLNQLNAEVPEVFTNNTKQRYIEMADAGVNLRDWLNSQASSLHQPSQVFDVLQQALTLAEKLARLDVWHLDLALRNFMVKPTNNLSPIKVCLIDFSLAVSKRFPLEKPLFMLPNKQQQHPFLFDAIKHDWQTFFNRNQLPEPEQYDFHIEIPMGIYKSDWSSDLVVDRISQPWCVIVHSLGNMLIQCSQLSCLQGIEKNQLANLANNMLLQTNDDLAKDSLAKAIIWLRSKNNDATPRPIPKPAEFNKQSLHNASPQIEVVRLPIAESQNASAKNGATNPKPIKKYNPFIMRFGLSMLVVIVAYLLIDALYVAYRIQISTYTISVVVVAFALSIGLLCSLPFRSQKLKLIHRMTQVMSLAMIGFSLELLLNRVAIQWPVLISIIAILLFRFNQFNKI